MTARNEVHGRPAWCRDETLALQRLVVEHRFTQQQLRVLREFDGTEPDQGRSLAYSTAKALRDRGFGHIEGKAQKGALSSEHPKAFFVLNQVGREIVAALRTASAAVEPAGT